MKSYKCNDNYTGYYGSIKEVYVDKLMPDHESSSCGINERNGNHVLISYTTTVCGMDMEGWCWCNGTYSATTRKHIGWFAKYLSNHGAAVSYQTFKRCYEDSKEYNIFTGEYRDASNAH